MKNDYSVFLPKKVNGECGLLVDQDGFLVQLGDMEVEYLMKAPPNYKSGAIDILIEICNITDSFGRHVFRCELEDEEDDQDEYDDEE